MPAVGSLIAGFVCFQVIQPFQRFSHAAAEDKKILVAGIAGEQDFRRFIKKTDAARRVAGHLDALDAAVSQFENIALVQGMECRHFERLNFVEIILICLIAAVSSNFISKAAQLFCVQVPCHSKICLAKIDIRKACRDAFQIRKAACGVNQKRTLLSDQKITRGQTEFVDGVGVFRNFHYHWFFYHSFVPSHT